MIGAIAGDIIGSVYEGHEHAIKTKDFLLFNPACRFTDDTVLTVAVADAIISGTPYREAMLHWGRRYPKAGYGGAFMKWLAAGNPVPYNSWGNGSAMRVSPVGFLFDSEASVLEEAKKSAEVTHSHSEGIKGAQATSLAIFMARKGAGKEAIRSRISELFDYDLDRSIDDIRPEYTFEISCQKSVPESIIAFLDSVSWEDAVRNAISLGGDSDTQACIAGGIAEAYYGGVPDEVRAKTASILTTEQRRVVSLLYEFRDS